MHVFVGCIVQVSLYFLLNKASAQATSYPVVQKGKPRLSPCLHNSNNMSVVIDHSHNCTVGANLVHSLALTGYIKEQLATELFRSNQELIPQSSRKISGYTIV